MQIYHYPQCSKSRKALIALQKNFDDIDIILYQQDILTQSQLTHLLKRYEGNPIDFVRKNEHRTFKEFTNLTDIVHFLVDHPECLQRPVIDDGTNVIIGRPIENLRKLDGWDESFCFE